MDLHWSQRFSLKFFVGKERASREADSEKRVCNHPGEQFLKICGFGELIHWVRVDRRLIRVKNIGFKKNNQIRVDEAYVDAFSHAAMSNGGENVI